MFRNLYCGPVNSMYWGIVSDLLYTHRHTMDSICKMILQLIAFKC